MIINPKEIPLPKLVSYLQGTVAPRPIALVSSVDQQGHVNLSPFSFFNLFSLNPPILVFSPSRRARNNTTKHTLENVLEVPEVVINMIHYDMVQQVSLASCDFPKGVNEFSKSGLTEVPSTVVKPPRVGESRVSFECKVNQVIPLGSEGGAGNLVLCEVQLIHINDAILDNEGRIDPQLLNAVARMGNDYYSRASGDAIFTVPKPNEKVGLGIDALPVHIRTSKILSGNDLGMLGNSERLPSADAIEQFKSEHPQFAHLSEEASHQQAKRFLQSGDVDKAWLVLMRERV